MKYDEIELELKDPKSQLSTVQNFQQLRSLIALFNKAKRYERKFNKIKEEINSEIPLKPVWYSTLIGKILIAISVVIILLGIFIDVLLLIFLIIPILLICSYQFGPTNGGTFD